VIVLDASAVVELLLDTTVGRRVAMLISDPATAVHVPHLVDVEAISALRRLCQSGEIQAEEADAAIDDLLALDLQRHSHEVLLERAWQLRKNTTPYDAVYVALAEALDAPLFTCDARLAKAPGTNAHVTVVK
jgi:predicted nucleic acid-binding protein